MNHEIDTAAQAAVEGGKHPILAGLEEAVAWTRGEIELPITEYADDGSVARRWVGGRETTGFLATLSPAQQEAAKAYRGHDDYTPVAQQQARPLVIIESPYGGAVMSNTHYARSCLEDSLERGESPLASHLLYTQVLDDAVPKERKTGTEAGLAWYRVAEKCVVYTDRGISEGMQRGIERARQHGVAVEYRTIY